MAHISDIKLIRTDTTLDLSQKAEKENKRIACYVIGAASKLCSASSYTRTVSRVGLCISGDPVFRLQRYRKHLSENKAFACSISSTNWTRIA
ncbi:hypothetical protein RND71_021529 [Anisodus tanguticus]|uniref:Uncharacterized protein n=1 Tax=Anisodus tanguticus TaxID=243964 RepID=A0AAE1RWE1_9SOLA|nr:hypothetical protein RND71_021529 [Anisodus tanguticus]